MLEVIVEVGEGLIGNCDVWVVVVLGEGDVFCVGFDVMSFVGFVGKDFEVLLMLREFG